MLRHLSRTHHVNLAWLTEVIQSDEMIVKYVATDLQAADIFTKMFTNAQKWNDSLKLIGLVDNPLEFEAPALSRSERV